MSKKISIARPCLGKEEEVAVIEVLRSAHLSQGEKVHAFEEAFSNYIGCKYSIAVSNGTAALHLALLSLGIGRGDTVITTPFSFVASASAITLTGATPIFVDIDPVTFNIDTNKIEEKIKPTTKAIIPVHIFGLAANMDEITRIAKKNKIKVIEDACQSHGATIRKVKVGSIGDIGCFSFYSTKNMTTGEGGMITTNNKSIYKKLLLLRNHGMEKRYFHKILGFNMRMTDIQAAIGIEQLKKLDKFNNIRIRNALSYNKNLRMIPKVIVPQNIEGHVYHQYTIQLENEKLRKELMVYLDSNGVGSEIYYPIPIHLQKIYKIKKCKLPISEYVSKHILSLPIHPGVSIEDTLKISKLIRSFFGK